MSGAIEPFETPFCLFTDSRDSFDSSKEHALFLEIGYEDFDEVRISLSVYVLSSKDSSYSE